RVVFAKPGEALATVNIFYNNGGTSTVQYQTGANHNLGKELADDLYETINPAEFEQVNMVLQGFVEANVLSVLQLSAEQPHIQFYEYLRNTHTTVWKIHSPVLVNRVALTS
ncbi:type II toxin-antitoxin system RnlA family toxin, partial [Bacillus sp. B-TM1]